MVELRWVVPAATTTQPPRLQYRQCPPFISLGEPIGWSDWRDVPCVVVQDAPVKAAGVQGCDAKLGMHWLESAHLRVAAGEPEAEVLEDFGYVKAGGVLVCDSPDKARTKPTPGSSTE